MMPLRSPWTVCEAPVPGEPGSVEVCRAHGGRGVVGHLAVTGHEGGVHAGLATQDLTQGRVELSGDRVAVHLELVERLPARPVELALERRGRVDQLADQQPEITAGTAGLLGQGRQRRRSHVEFHESLHSVAPRSCGSGRVVTVS